MSGILQADYLEPTHNKQDFERTSLFQKFELRLKQMTWEYWYIVYANVVLCTWILEIYIFYLHAIFSSFACFLLLKHMQEYSV